VCRRAAIEEDQVQHAVGIDPDPDSDTDTDEDQKNGLPTRRRTLSPLARLRVNANDLCCVGGASGRAE